VIAMVESAEQEGEILKWDAEDRPLVPDTPVIPYIEGDGIGPDIWAATRDVLDAAVAAAYSGRKRIVWREVLVGKKAQTVYGEDHPLPRESLDTIRTYGIAIKGPLTTPVGGGFRSLNVALRQVLDLYACVRPVRHMPGVPSPVVHPEQVDVVIFRENTEDVYAGIEFEAGSEESDKIIELLKSFGKNPREKSAIGIKPISEVGSKRLVRMAIRYAIENNRKSVTLVHKGNIMKFTEGYFKSWGYELAKEEFRDYIVTEEETWEGDSAEGKILINDRIADSMFQQILLRPDEYDVIATPNLNGDYLSDAGAAQVGGLGLAPGANVRDDVALFEATHGTAPKYAGQDKVNPSSVLLSGVMMLEHMKWKEAAELVTHALEKTILQKKVTYDLARQLDGVDPVKASEFGDAIISNL